MDTHHSLPPLPVIDSTGSVLRREALELGLTQREIERLVHSGVWVRVRYGAYAPADRWQQMGPEQQHLVRANAVVRSLGEPAVLGHVSAAVAHGIPVWGADLSRVHVVRGADRHGSRTEAGVVHHAASLPTEHLITVSGLDVTTSARTLVDMGRSVGFESAVVSMDAALRAEKTTVSDLQELMVLQSDWPGARAAHRAVHFADGLSESVGESRGRVRISQAGLPVPELQVRILDEDGSLVARSDYLFRAQRTIGEFDGRIKYRTSLVGEALEDALWQEKLREDRLRALGYEVVRFTWADLERAPAWLRGKVLAAFARAQGRSAPLGYAV